MKILFCLFLCVLPVIGSANPETVDERFSRSTFSVDEYNSIVGEYYWLAEFEVHTQNESSLACSEHDIAVNNSLFALRRYAGLHGPLAGPLGSPYGLSGHSLTNHSISYFVGGQSTCELEGDSNYPGIFVKSFQHNPKDDSLKLKLTLFSFETDKDGSISRDWIQENFKVTAKESIEFVCSTLAHPADDGNRSLFGLKWKAEVKDPSFQEMDAKELLCTSESGSVLKFKHYTVEAE